MDRLEEKKVYAMLDLEFTSLNLFESHITEFGIMDISPNGWRYEMSCPVLESQWNPDTLEFAKNTYTPDQLLLYVTDPRHIGSMEDYQLARLGFFKTLIASLDQLIVHAGGKENFFLIVNHPEVDITLIKYWCWKYKIDYPVHYRNHLDMQSLAMGTAGGVFHEIYSAMRDQDKKAGKRVAHTALADCIGQTEYLEFFGVRLPE